jgi:hypothetical protein
MAELAATPVVETPAAFDQDAAQRKIVRVLAAGQ